jgi:HAD superfamily hydrolase (TIGR01509 family)
MILSTAVQALIFDFDGVLADTEPLHCAAFQAAVGELGVHLTRAEYYARFLGLPDRACLTAVCAAAGKPADAGAIDALLERKRAAFARIAHDARLYPGVAAVLRRLHAHFILAIASGAFRDEIEPVLAHDAVRPLFTAVVGAEDVAAGKPAPDPFLHAWRAINRAHGDSVPAAACVVIEDSPHGVAAARAAGMRCIAVTTHHGADTLAGADAVIAHVTQLRVEDFRRE